METKIVYMDESGDSGKDNNSKDGSPYFILTSIAMNANDWQNNFNQYKNFKRFLKDKYGWHVTEEMHTKDFLYDHNPYRKYGWDSQTRKSLLNDYIACFTNLSFETVNVIIDKSIIKNASYRVLENAVKYNIQRIDNTYRDKWNYIIISDTGRVKEMRKIARSICAYNQVPVESLSQTENMPIKNMIEDILEKDSSDSFFVQIADCISYMVNLYYKVHIKNEDLPGRVGCVLDKNDIVKIMDYFEKRNILNTKASNKNKYGLVIYPK